MFKSFSIKPVDEYQKEISDILSAYEHKANRKQALSGIVVSTKCSKSILVRIKHQRYIPKYNKHISIHKKIMAHDEEEKGKLGDLVRIIPCRPMSKKKRHKLCDILRKGINLDDILSNNIEESQKL